MFHVWVNPQTEAENKKLNNSCVATNTIRYTIWYIFLKMQLDVWAANNFFLYQLYPIVLLYNKL